MTEQEFMDYKMNHQEEKKWAELTNDIIEGFYSLESTVCIPANIFHSSLEKLRDVKRPWEAKGYIAGKGFYHVVEGDRGHISVRFSDLDYSDARNKLISSTARDIAYAYVISDMKGIQTKYESQWRYKCVEDGIVKENGDTRMISHLEEQQNWIYDAEYDYRIYWFEPLLFMVKRLADDTEYQSTLAYYESCMNHHLKNKRWVYDTKIEKFELRPDNT